LPRFLVDASALKALAAGDPTQVADVLERSAVLELTYYEVGNALWKELNLLKAISAKECETLVDSMKRMLATAETLETSFDELGDVLGLAGAEGLTFYDAAYVDAARKAKRTLVTEDPRLTRAAAKYVAVKRASEV